ncbi:MAG: transposase [Thermoleophilaceae bacterium]
MLDRLHRENPDFGRDLAIDASDLPAYANGQRYLSKNGPERKRYSDPDASWGHRSAVSTRKGGGFYGYKVHAAVCARTDLPVAWQVETARAHESSFATGLLDAAKDRGFAAETTALDMGYDTEAIHAACEARWLPSDHPAQADSRREGREGEPAELRARNVDLRGVRPLARSVQVALPDWRVSPRLDLDQGRPPPPSRPSRDEGVEVALPGPWLCRARVRTAQA